MGNMVSHRTLSVHKEHEFLLKLEAAGLSNKLAQKVIDSKHNIFATKILDLIARFEPTTSQERAREIMGRNFFGIEEAIEHFGVKPSDKDLSKLALIPFLPETLEELKESHILAAVFPLSILDIYEKVEEQQLFFYIDANCVKEFAEEKGELGWHLIRKTEVPDSSASNWKYQLKGIKSNEEIPSARIIAYVAIGYFLATNEKIFELKSVRTSSKATDGERLTLSHTGQQFSISFNRDREFYYDLGIASARKPDK